MKDFVTVPVLNSDGDTTGHERVEFETAPFGNMVQIFNVDFKDAHQDDVCAEIRANYSFIENITFKK